MVVLIFGKDGQLGRELCRSMSVLGDVVALNRMDCDLTDDASIIATLRAHRPDIIVNAAAYTEVEKAESNSHLAYAVNAIAPEIIAKEAILQNSLMIHFSTDYVFDGHGKAPYLETNEPNPINVYGASKLAGELAIQKHCEKYLIIRTSWVFASIGENFLKKILRAAKSQNKLSVVCDQFGVPTSASLIADVTAHLVVRYYQSPRSNIDFGLYHMVAGGLTSWYEYALYVLERAISLGFVAKVSPNDVLPINTSSYCGAAARPLYTVLDTSKLQSTFNLRLPCWRDGVDYTLDQIFKGHL